MISTKEQAFVMQKYFFMYQGVISIDGGDWQETLSHNTSTLFHTHEHSLKPFVQCRVASVKFRQVTPPSTKGGSTKSAIGSGQPRTAVAPVAAR